MSYIVYINGFQILLAKDRPIALTKQVNDLAQLDNRQSNFTNRLIAPYNAVNDKIMGNLGMVGNRSNVPYQKNRVDIIDSETGKHLIYNGWATVSKTQSRGYEINCYDGIIDFYRRIENKNISDIGVSELDHLKNMANVIATFTDDTLMYKYIIADYNGNAFVDGKINIDYLVPSARKSYIWNRIHEFAGFTYSGEVFNSEKFLNNFITFPKPVPNTEPSLINVSSQNSTITAGSSDFFNSFTILNFFPANFSDAYANNTGQINYINISTTGVYFLKMSGTGPVVSYIIFNSGLVAQSSGTINPTINEGIYLNLQAGDRVLLYHFIPTQVNVTDQVFTEFSYVDGYYANFNEVLIDFAAKDFVNEIMTEFALTAFKDKYSNHIVYKNLDEVLQSEDVVDWSKNYKGDNGASYSIGKYAKKNLFTYKYNDENLRYNNGFISINNENLPDETTVINSKFYTPDRPRLNFLSDLSSNVYKIWEKELKDDSSIEYKELSGRFYSLRYQNKTIAVTLISEALGVNQTVDEIPFENYLRMGWNQIIIDNYRSIESIFDKAKVQDLFFDLSFQEFEAFNMDKLIYVDKKASYYLVNKIKSFIKGQQTIVEVIEVDYLKQIEVNEPIDYFINITSIIQDLCEFTFNVNTNIEQPADIFVQPYAITPDGAGSYYYAPYGELIPVSLSGNQVIHTFTELPEMFFGGYKFKLVYLINSFLTAESSLTDLFNISGSCYVPPVIENPLSYLTITNVQTLAVINNGNTRRLQVDYISDLNIASIALRLIATNSEYIYLPTFFDNFFATPSGNFVIEVPNKKVDGSAAYYNLQIVNVQFNINSNIANS